MKREFTVLVEQGEDGYLVGSVPSIPGCYSQARTMEELLERLQEAIVLCLEEFDESDHESDPPVLSVQKVAV